MITEITILTTTILTVTCERRLEPISPDSKELPMPRLETVETTTMSNINQTYTQNPDIPCGLPPFVDKMPKKQRSELKSIWKDYKSGKSCGLHQAKTFDIVNTLTDEERIQIFGMPPNVAPVPVPEVGISVVPMFIRTSPPHTKQLFDSILANDTLEETEKFEAMEQLAAQVLSQGQLADFKMWITTLRIQKAKIDARIDALSEDANEILRQITELRLREKKILQNLSPKVALELAGLI